MQRGANIHSIRAAIGLLAMLSVASDANADASIELLWGGTSVSTSVAVNASTIVSLHVVLTNLGPQLSQGGGVTIDYSLPRLRFVSFDNNPNSGSGILDLSQGTPTDTGTQVRNINASTFFPFIGTGLGVGASYLLGTIQFRPGPARGTFELTSLLTASDALIREDGSEESNATFDSASVFVPEPGSIATALAAATALIGVALVRRSRQPKRQLHPG